MVRSRTNQSRALGAVTRGPHVRAADEPLPTLRQILTNRSLRSVKQLQNATIAMDAEEADLLLDSLLRPGIRNYAEWGSGGSTFLLAWLLTTQQLPEGSRAVSIESSPEFMASLRAKPMIARAEQLQLLRYAHGDLGPVGHIGRPARCSEHTRHEACKEVDSAPYVELAPYGIPLFDVILVDGRYRAACLLEALRYSHRDTRVLLHDARNYAFSYQHWFTLVAERRTMRVMRPRKLFGELSERQKLDYKQAVAAKRTIFSR